MDSVLKLCSELANAGEEYVLLTAGNGGNHKQFGSVKGRQFLQANQDLAQRFFCYCYNAASSTMYMGGQPYSHSMEAVSMATNRNSAVHIGHSQQTVSDSAASTIAGALQSLATEFHMGRPQNPVMMHLGNTGISGGEEHPHFEMTSQDRDVMSTYMGNVPYGSHHSNIHIGNINDSNICIQDTNSRGSDYLIRSNIGNFSDPTMNREGLIPNLNEDNAVKSRQDFTENQKESAKFVGNENEVSNFVENQNKSATFSDNQNTNPSFESKSQTENSFEDNPKNQTIDQTKSSTDLEPSAVASDGKDLENDSEKDSHLAENRPAERQFDVSDDSNFSIGFETDFTFRDQQNDLKLVISNVVSCLDREQDAEVKKERNLDEKEQNKQNSDQTKLRKNKKVLKETRQTKARKVKQASEEKEDSDDLESDDEQVNSEDGDYNVSDGNDSEATIVSDSEINDTSRLRGAAKRKATFQCHRCGVCRKTFANSSNLRRHEKSHGVQGDQRRCTKCNEFVLVNDMKRHLKLKHANDNKRQKLHCKECGKICMSKKLLRQHVSKQHMEVKYNCEKCDKVFMSEDAYKSHLVKHLQKHFCVICQQNFPTRASLTRHTAAEHPNHTQFEILKCNVCGRRRGQEHKCPGKKVKVHREFICQICNKQFSRIQNLNLHRRIHSDNRTKLKCELCEKLFSDRCSLKKHIRYVHSAERNFICDVCGKSFKQNDTLKNHVRIHAEEKTDEFKCQLCSKLLSSKSALNVHQRSHTGAKPYMCEICGMSFRQVANMRKHMLIHTTAKANQCDLCGKEYKYRDSWKAHMRSHVIKEGLRREVIKTKYGKVYNCEYCQKQFSTASQYKVHLRTHTDERPFKCDLCEKAFKEKGKLSRHVNRVHVHSQVLSLHPHQKVSMDSRIVVPVPNDHVMYYAGSVAGV